MIRKLLTIAATAGVLVATPTLAAQCRDAKGKFIKCADQAASSSVTKDKNGKCRVASCLQRGVKQAQREADNTTQESSSSSSTISLALPGVVSLPLCSLVLSLHTGCR